MVKLNYLFVDPIHMIDVNESLRLIDKYITIDVCGVYLAVDGNWGTSKKVIYLFRMNINEN